MAASTIIRVDGEEIAMERYRDLRDLTIRESTALPASLVLAFSMMRGGDGLWSNLDDLEIELWAPISVSALFPGESEQEMFSGYVTQLAPRFPRELDQCRMEIVALDISCLMDREEKVVVWEDQTDREIFESIVQAYGLSAEAEDTKAEAWAADQTPLVQRGTDWQFLQELARRNGFECFLRESTAYFRRPAVGADSAPALGVHFGAASSVKRMDFDLDGLAPREVRSFGWDAFKKEAFEATEQAPELEPLGQEAAQDLPDASSQGGGAHCVHLRGVASWPSSALTALGAGAVQSFAWPGTVEAEVDGDAYGNFLRCGQPVTIKGVGESFSGSWYVTEAEHQLLAEGYSLRFQARRNAVGSTGEENYG